MIRVKSGQSICDHRSRSFHTTTKALLFEWSSLWGSEQCGEQECEENWESEHFELSLLRTKAWVIENFFFEEASWGSLWSGWWELLSSQNSDYIGSEEANMSSNFYLPVDVLGAPRGANVCAREDSCLSWASEDTKPNNRCTSTKRNRNASSVIMNAITWCRLVMVGVYSFVRSL